MKRYALVSALCILLFTNPLHATTADELGVLSGKCTKGDEQACKELQAAIDKLTDQALLATIAVKEEDPNVRLLAVYKLTDQALLAKIAVGDNDQYVRSAAVINLTDQNVLVKIAIEADEFGLDVREAFFHLTDQTLLARIAVEARNADVRKLAVKDLTDQALRAKIAIEAKDAYVRATAVEDLTNQALLAKIAVEDNNTSVRATAVYNLTNQALLVKFAVEDKDSDVRAVAVQKLTDQMLLAKVAVEVKDSDTGIAAVEKLTDQAPLAKAAVGSKNLEVRKAAVGKLTNQALLARIADDDMNPVIRSVAIASMDESNPALKRLAFLGDSSLAGTPSPVAYRSRTGRSIARIKLAIQEPRIRSRFPGIVSAIRVDAVSQSYTDNKQTEGESISVVLSQSSETLATGEWSTDFPMLLLGSSPHIVSAFRPAEVHGESLLTELLHNPVFTQDDLAELSSSKIPEVRLAAIANLTGQALLVKIATGDKSSDVRSAARRRLADIRDNTK